MKERPIIFSGDSVRAILDGHKTQTRRVVKQLQNSKCFTYWNYKEVIKPELGGLWIDDNCVGGRVEDGRHVNCPYGKPGDRLWVKESAALQSYYNIEMVTLAYRSHHFPSLVPGRHAIASFEKRITEIPYRLGKYTSALFMPRWASRITLEITNVWIERLQDITDDDAVAEGVMGDEGPYDQQSPVMCFETAWNKINGKKYPWGSNPFVWVIEFKQIERK